MGTMRTTRRGFWGSFASVFGVSALAVSEIRQSDTKTILADTPIEAEQRELLKCTCFPHPMVLYDATKIEHQAIREAMNRPGSFLPIYRTPVGSVLNFIHQPNCPLKGTLPHGRSHHNETERATR